MSLPCFVLFICLCLVLFIYLCLVLFICLCPRVAGCWQVHLSQASVFLVDLRTPFLRSLFPHTASLLHWFNYTCNWPSFLTSRYIAFAKTANQYLLGRPPPLCRAEIFGQGRKKSWFTPSMFCFMLWMLNVLFHVANLVPGYLRCCGSVYLEYATCQLEENTVFNIQSLQKWESLCENCFEKQKNQWIKLQFPFRYVCLSGWWRWQGWEKIEVNLHRGWNLLDGAPFWAGPGLDQPPAGVECNNNRTQCSGPVVQKSETTIWSRCTIHAKVSHRKGFHSNKLQNAKWQSSPPSPLQS